MFCGGLSTVKQENFIFLQHLLPTVALLPPALPPAFAPPSAFTLPPAPDLPSALVPLSAPHVAHLTACPAASPLLPLTPRLSLPANEFAHPPVPKNNSSQKTPKILCKSLIFNSGNDYSSCTIAILILAVLKKIFNDNVFSY